MIEIKNSFLSVNVLDPVEDRERFGTRYCTGGYIFQIEDSERGPLLSGPTYPESFNWFDGQGIPDSFHLNPLRSSSDNSGVAMVVGIGTCNLKENTVIEHCEWDLRQEQNELEFSTTQDFENHRLTLSRIIRLEGRTVRSESRLKNIGGLNIAIRWFPHPFFPQPESDEICKMNIDLDIPVNEGFVLAESGFIRRKNWPWKEGYFQALDHWATSELVILQKHPVVGLVAGTCSYAPGFFPIWGNRKTVSWEPYFERTVAMDQNVSWFIEYDF